jgi:uncharacterized protein
MERNNVPCNGCTACCRNDMIVLHPECGDDVSAYQHHKETCPLTGAQVPVLDKKADRTCVYLGDRGCTIWDRAPTVCREFDCRLFYTEIDRRLRKHLLRQGMVGKEVLKAARERLSPSSPVPTSLPRKAGLT